MKLDIRSEKSLYIEIGGWTFYIDDSTNEQIMSKWETITGDSDTDELLEDEKKAQEDPLERFIDCPQCHEESGCYVRKGSFKECKHCGYYNNEDGKNVGTKYCDICGKDEGNIIERRDSNSGNYYNVCDQPKCDMFTDDEDDEEMEQYLLSKGKWEYDKIKGTMHWKDKSKDGKVSCDKCGNFTDERQMNYDHKDGAICWKCESDDDSCDECGGDGFLEYDESSKEEGEVIESYGKEECNKCNGKGII